jgi:hemerythrin
MALINWNDNLSVKVTEFDEQHKKLIGMVNNLHSAMGAGKSREIMGSVLTGLIDYTVNHFAAEEKLMQKHGYPSFARHKAEHDALTKQVVDIMAKFKEGKTVVTIELMNFLKDWLTKHIQGTDKQYGPFLNSKNVQ